MGHAHHHGHGHAHVGEGGAGGVALWASLALTLLLGAIQVGSAIAFDSLVLAADAVHNLSDVIAVGIALGAARLAGLPARGARTFGLRRAEVVGASLNATLLIVLSAWIAWEAVGRLASPPAVDGVGVAIVGGIAVVLNAIPVILLLRAGARRNLNLRATMLHFAADILSSLAALAAGVVIALTGWGWVDGAAGIAVAALIALASAQVLRASLRVLLEVAPAGTDPDAIGRRLASLPGVVDVHDLHVWTISDGFPAFATHVIVTPAADPHAMLHRIEDVLRDEFGIAHMTIQIDVDHATGLAIQPRLAAPERAR